MAYQRLSPGAVADIGKARHVLRPAGALLAVVCVGASLFACADSAPAPSATSSVNSLLSKLPVQPEDAGGFTASAFGSRIDADLDGCETGKEVLRAESLITEVVGVKCSVAGKWRSFYDDSIFTAPSGVRTDLLVTISEAWESGASSWSADRRLAYVNDVGYEWSLNVVSRTSSTARGAKGPETWLPSAGQRCAYVAAWVGVKSRWGLAVNAGEKEAVQAALNKCPHLTVSTPDQPDIQALAGSEAVPAGVDSSATTLVGWSGAKIAGLDNQIFGTWMARDSWAGMAAGQWLSANAGYTAFVAAHPDRAADIGVPLIPHDSGVPLNQLLDEAIAGKRDSEYRAMGASLAKGAPETLYARLYWEMNMSPQPAKSLDRSKFKAAWDRAVPLIREGFAATAPSKDLKVVFCPISDGADYSAFYPSSSNVDVIAMDVYAAKWGAKTPTAAVLTASVQLYLDSIAAFAKEKGKPVALGEWANWQTGAQGSTNNHGRGDFPAYIDQVFDWAEKNDAAYVVYFNLADGGVGQSLAETPASLQRLLVRAGN